MFFILPCSTCGKKLRFPLDKGKIRVTCTCGNSFIADPDDTELYKRGSFDVGEGKKKASLFQRTFSSAENFSFQSLVDSAIKKLIDFKYRIQNFRLLPASEQKKLLIRLLLAALVAGLLLFFFIIGGRNPSPGGSII